MNEKLWHYARNGERHGPVTATQLKELATTGQLFPDDLVWREDMTEWRRAGSVKGLLSEQSTAIPKPPPLPQKTSRDIEATTQNPKRFLWGCLLFPVVIALLLPAVQRARDTARKAYAERQAADIQSGQNPEGSERTASGSTKPVEIGTLEELGEKAYANLPFADVDRSPDTDAVPLSESFAQAGTFRFRRISPFITKATFTRQE